MKRLKAVARLRPGLGLVPRSDEFVPEKAADGRRRPRIALGYCP